MSAAFGVQANPVTGTDVLRYWYTSDDGDGPSPTRWSTHLKIAWANKGGDFVDAKGVAQGSTPFVSQPVAAPGNVVVAIGNPLAFRKGMLLRLTGKSDPSVTFAGRLSESPPVLAVARNDGSVVKLRPLSFAAWNSSSSSAMDSRQQVKLSSGSGSALLLFDIPGDAKSATMILAGPRETKANWRLCCFSRWIHRGFSTRMNSPLCQALPPRWPTNTRSSRILP